MTNLFPLAKPFLQGIEPERAHDLTIVALRSGLGGCDGRKDDPVLATQVMGLSFPNPLGIAAGFDKNAAVPIAVHNLGMGFAEVGSITPKPQQGNPRPRVFRLSEDLGVINRLGFNNQGLDVAEARLSALPPQRRVVGANIGANKDSVDRSADYVLGLRRLYPHADYFTVNISSPNTPGLRDLQGKAALEDLLVRLNEVRDGLKAPRKPIVLKVAPDLIAKDIEDIAAAVLASGIEGLIISNTTLSRPETLQSKRKSEAGGLSGAPLYALSTKVLSEFRKITGAELTLIGVGGVHDGRTAYGKIKAGASLVQLYSALTYGGPPLIRQIKTELAALLKADGFAHVADAVGSDHA